MILKQLPSENTSFERNVRENNEFKVSDKTFKGTKDSSLINSLPLHNKFTPLNHIKIKDDVMNVSADKKDTNKTESSRNTKSSKRTINIIGDSLLKDVKPYQLKHKVKKNDKLYVQSYRGARTSAMKHHANASLEFKPDIFILHCGTNDLKLEKTPEKIADDILEIGLQLKSDNNDVYISGILTRRDDLNDKGRKVNDYLNQFLKTDGVDYIVASDTDSIYVTMEELVNKFLPNETSTKKIVLSSIFALREIFKTTSKLLILKYCIQNQ